MSAGVAQLPDVLAVQALELVADVDPPVAAALAPHPGRVVLPRDHLDERGTAPARMPVTVPSRQQLSQPHARLRQGGEQEPVPHRPSPPPGPGVLPGARVQDRLDLRRGQQRDRPGRRAADADGGTGALPAALQMGQTGNIPARPPAGPVKTVSDRNLVGIGVITVERQHGGDPGSDRRLRRARNIGGGRERGHPGGQPGPQPGHERDEEWQPDLVPRRPRRRQELPPAGQGRGIGTDRVRRGLLGHPQELKVFLDRAGRKVIVPRHRPCPLPVEQNALHPHGRPSCRRRRR